MLVVAVKQEERVYILWRDVMVPGIVTCSTRRIADTQWQACI